MKWKVSGTICNQGLIEPFEVCYDYPSDVSKQEVEEDISMLLRNQSAYCEDFKVEKLER